MFNVADLAKYDSFYEVYMRKGSQENSVGFGVEELDEAKKLYKFKKENGYWDYVELKIVLDFHVKVD